MKNKRKLNSKKLKEKFLADFDDGKIYRRLKSGRLKECAYDVGNGRMAIHHEGRHVARGRVIYAMYHGDIEPWMVVQHINADDTDDSINNLRLVTRTLARRRRRQYSNNTSGFIGVSWHKMSRKWYAYVFVDKKLINLGTYHDPREAARVHDRAKVQAYGIEHAWTNARAGLLDDERKAA